jgi:transposase
LSAHQVLDLLPERTTESAAAWMREHPEVRYVSRDRGKDYATACREGAPQAVAIADRFHVMKNFVEALEPEVARCYKHLRQMSAPVSDERGKVASREEERKRLERLPDKSERFEQVKALLSHGFSPQEVADLLALEVANGLSVARARELPCTKASADGANREAGAIRVGSGEAAHTVFPTKRLQGTWP